MNRCETVLQLLENNEIGSSSVQGRVNGWSSWKIEPLQKINNNTRNNLVRTYSPSFLRFVMAFLHFSLPRHRFQWCQCRRWAFGTEENAALNLACRCNMSPNKSQRQNCRAWNKQYIDVYCAQSNTNTYYKYIWSQSPSAKTARDWSTCTKPGFGDKVPNTQSKSTQVNIGMPHKWYIETHTEKQHGTLQKTPVEDCSGHLTRLMFFAFNRLSSQSAKRSKPSQPPGPCGVSQVGVVWNSSQNMSKRFMVLQILLFYQMQETSKPRTTHPRTTAPASLTQSHHVLW